MFAVHFAMFPRAVQEQHRKLAIFTEKYKQKICISVKTNVNKNFYFD